MNFFYTKLSFSRNHPFRQVILLEPSIKLKCYTVVQVAHVFDPVSLHANQAFTVRHFSYLLSYFLNFHMHVILYCQLSQFILHAPQPIDVFSPYSPLHLASQFLFVLFPIRRTISPGLIQITDSASTALSYCLIVLVYYYY